MLLDATDILGGTIIWQEDLVENRLHVCALCAAVRRWHLFNHTLMYFLSLCIESFEEIVDKSLSLGEIIETVTFGDSYRHGVTFEF